MRVEKRREAKQNIGVTINNLLCKRPTGENVFRRAADKIFCTACNITLGPRKSILDTHIRSSNHCAYMRKRFKQTQIRDAIDDQSMNNLDIGLTLVEAFLSANIPLNKLSNPLLKSFLETYLPCKLVSITTMRSKYIDRLYGKLLSAVKSRIRGELNFYLFQISITIQYSKFYLRFRFIYFCKGKKCWISVDETLDGEGRHVAAVILRTLEEQSCRPYLLKIFDLKKTNGETIFHAVDDAIRVLGDAINRDDILVLLTDAAAYMILAG